MLSGGFVEGLTHPVDVVADGGTFLLFVIKQVYAHAC